MFDFLSSQRTPYTPYTEPEKTRLELGKRDCGPWARRLDWSTTVMPGEEKDRSNFRGSEARTGYMGLSPGSRRRNGRFLLLQAKTCMVSHHHLRAARCRPLHHPVLLPPHPGRQVTGHHHLQHSAKAATSGATWWRCPSGGCRGRRRVTRK